MPQIQTGGVGRPQITVNVPPGGRGPGSFNGIKGYWDGGNFRADGPPGALAKTGRFSGGMGAGAAGLAGLAGLRVPNVVGLGLGLLGLSAIIALMERNKGNFDRWYDGQTGHWRQNDGGIFGGLGKAQTSVTSWLPSVAYSASSYLLEMSGTTFNFYSGVPGTLSNYKQTAVIWGPVASVSLQQTNSVEFGYTLQRWHFAVTRTTGEIQYVSPPENYAHEGVLAAGYLPGIRRQFAPTYKILTSGGAPIPPKVVPVPQPVINIDNTSSSTTIIHNHQSFPDGGTNQRTTAFGQIGASIVSPPPTDSGGYISQGQAQEGTPPPPTADPFTPTPITIPRPFPPPITAPPPTPISPPPPALNETRSWVDSQGNKFQTISSQGSDSSITQVTTQNGKEIRRVRRTINTSGDVRTETYENGRQVKIEIGKQTDKGVNVTTYQNGAATNTESFARGTAQFDRATNPTPTIDTPETSQTRIISAGKLNDATTTSTSTQAANNATATIVNQSPLTVESGSPVNLTPLMELSAQIKSNQESSIIPALSDVATIGVLTPFILGQTELINTNTNNKIAAIPVPTPCAYPAYHPSTVAERSAISGKVDLANTTLGVVSNTQLSVIDSKLGPQVNGGISGWLGRFSRSLYLDRIYNGMSLMLQIHNAAMLSRNLAESISTLIEAGMNALNLKNEDDEAINIPEMIGSTVTNWIKAVVGEEVFNGVSAAWKKLSAIYTAAVNIYELMLNSLAGIAEGLETMGRYTGKIGNALKKGGVILENAYEWMDENVKVKTGRFSAVEKVTQGLSDLTDVTDNLTEVAETVSETTENVTQIQSEFSTIKEATAEAETAKDTAETAAKTVSQSGAIAKSDLNPPES